MTKPTIKLLETKLDQHICDYESMITRLERLMPLADLIPVIEQIVEDKKTDVAMNVRFARWSRGFLAIGGVIAAIFTIVQLIFRLKD